MSNGETIDFVDYHRWRLERIIDLTDRLSSMAQPTWAFSLSPDKKLQLEPSVLKNIADQQVDLGSKNHDGLNNFLESRRHVAHIEIISAYATGIMNQAKGLTEEKINMLDLPGPNDPNIVLTKCSDAWFVMHEFTDRETGDVYEASRTKIIATGINDQQTEVEVVNIQKKDDLLSERLTISRADGALHVFRQVNPAEDELLQRLMKISQISEEYSDFELYEAGFAALIGAPNAERELDELPIYGHDEELDQLMSDLRQRLKMVRASKDMNFDKGLPTEAQLDHMIERLEEMAESPEL